MTLGSLFTGIGGFDLGFERAGFEIKWQCEIDPFCQRVLAKHWPNVTRYFDVRALKHPERVDVLCGGFPCQPVSLAGARRKQADERWLWPEFARLVRALRPRYVVVENVPGLLTAGMGDVVGDLAGCGYDAEWQRIPAAAVGAPHLRHRIWIVAYPGGDELRHESGWRGGARGTGATVARDDGAVKSLAHADSRRQQECSQRDGDASSNPADWNSRGPHTDRRRDDLADADESRSQGHRRLRVFRDCSGEQLTRSCGGSVEGHWFTEPDVGRVAHGVPARVDRLRGPRLSRKSRNGSRAKSSRRKK